MCVWIGVVVGQPRDMLALHGVQRTGRGLATLLRVAVRAANEGQMAKMRSTWDLFLKVSPLPCLPVFTS